VFAFQDRECRVLFASLNGQRNQSRVHHFRSSLSRV
jgi:hypothetical protein